MRIGLSSALEHETPEQWAEQMKELGCRAVVFPVDYTAPDHVIADYAEAARNNDLLIAEVGIWKNVFAVDPSERHIARERAIGQLRLADEIGARCCVNVAGTYGGPKWDGGYKENYTKKCWDMTIEYIQELIDKVKPARTKYCVESMPWMYPSGPDEYLKMLEEVDRPAFAVHMDIVNMINTPKRYFFSDDFLQECFDKLGDAVCSCHLKDVVLRNEYTFQLKETGSGKGTLNIEKYISLIDQYDPQMPVIIEHLGTDEEYKESLGYVQARLKAAGF